MKQDILYGLRQLRANPGITLVAVLSLALGIGANTAIFQLLDALRVRHLPVVRNPDQLVTIDYAPNSARMGWYTTRSARHTSRGVQEILAQQQAFQQIMAWSATRFNLANGGEPRYAEGLFVSGNFFETLRVPPLAGRTLSPTDDTPACSAPGAVISHAFWQRELNGEPSALGRTISLDGHAFPIIGITPAAFFGVEVGRRFDIAIPLCADPTFSDSGKGRASFDDAWWISLMGRLKPGVTREAAKANLESISPAVMRASLPVRYQPDDAKRYLANKLDALEGATGVSNLRRRYEQPLWILMAITGLVLLIACANVANILLARASVRERELTVRLALGASRGRLIRQLLVESLLLSLGAAIAGIALAALSSRLLVAAIATGRDPVFVDLTPDWRLIGFTIALAAATCLLFGLLPAFRATGITPAAGGRSVTAGRERAGLRRVLVATQVALSLVLLAGSLLFVRTLQNLMYADTGFNAQGVLSVSFNYRRANIPEDQRHAMARRLSDTLAATPGVLSTGEAQWTPISGAGWDQSIGPDGAPAANSGKDSLFLRIGPGYFKTMETPLITGREFTDRDTVSTPLAAIVNEEFARRYYNNNVQIVGRTFRMSRGAGIPEPLYEIIGVVRTSKYYELREQPRPQAFFAAAQQTDPSPEANFVVRVSSPSAASLVKSIQRATAEINPLIGVEFRSFSAQLQESLQRDRLMATLSAAFATLAVVLSAIGLYGVISYMVARRRNEIGVRMALGAGRPNVIALVLRETALLVATGLAAGLLIAFWTGRSAASMLYNVQPFDPIAIGASIAILIVTALAASYAPARRAASLEPMLALRQE